MENHSAIANQLEQLDAARAILQSQLGREVSKLRAEAEALTTKLNQIREVLK